MKKIICVLLAVCLLVLSVGCDSTKTTQSEDLGDSSATPPEIRLSVKETLDLVLSAQEQEKFSKVIDNAVFTHHPSWSSVYYWGIADAIDETLSYPAEYVFDRHNVRRQRKATEIGISAVRGGTIVGDHDIIFAGNDEVIELSHHAASKEIFAVGAIKAAKFMVGKPSGMYNMDMLVSEMV